MTQAQPADVAVPPPATADLPMPRILYVMGMGRSGTTILEVLLVNNPGVTGIGEAKYVFRHGFIQNRACSCGQGARECAQWASVIAGSGWDEAQSERLARLADRIERHIYFLPRWLGRFDRSDLTEYRAVHEYLFKTVAASARAEVVVDSSKYQVRGLALARLFPGRVKVLFMTRSAQTLIEAFRKTDDEDEIRTKTPIQTAIYYLYTLVTMWLVRLELKQDCMAVRFEALRRDPDVVLGAIEAWSGVSMAEARRKLAAQEPFTVGHMISGNRLRKKGMVRFESNPSETAKPVTRGILACLLELARNLLRF
jgi:hypothetical protein